MLALDTLEKAMDHEQEYNIPRYKTACFTGHREIPDHLVESIRSATKEAVASLIDKGYDCFVAGGARGYDALAAETVLELKRQHLSTRLVIVLPFPRHYQWDEWNWTQGDIAQYHRLKALASEVIVVSETYVRGVFKMRDRRMVDMSSVCIAYLDNPKSGTGYTVKYARSQKLSIIDIASMLDR